MKGQDVWYSPDLAPCCIESLRLYSLSSGGRKPHGGMTLDCKWCIHSMYLDDRSDTWRYRKEKTSELHADAPAGD